MRKLKKSTKKSSPVRTWFKQRYSLILGFGAALVAVLLSGNFLYNYSQDHARVLRVSGAALIERDNEKITATPGMVLNARDKIITGEGSFIEVTYDDTHRDVLRVGGDSRVVLESAVIEKETTIFMDKGEIVVKLEKLEKGSTFKVRTPTAVAGVRGTSFGVRLAEKDKEAVITDFESRIFVKGITEDFLEMNDELLLNVGWKVKVVQFEKPVRVEKITEQERAAWLLWLNEIETLPKDVSPDTGRFSGRGLVFNLETALHLIRLPAAQLFLGGKHEMVMSKFIMHVTSSVSILAFLLYVALTFNIGRIFLWQKNTNKTNTLNSCGI